MQPVVLVMPGETGAAGHKRVVAVADGVGGDVAEIGSGPWRRLLRHSDRLIAADEDELGAVHVVRLEENSVPGGVLRTSRQNRARHVVQSGCSADEVAVPLPKPGAILAVLGHNLKVDVRAKVKLPDKSFSAEGLVADSRTRDDGCASTGGGPSGGRKAHKGVSRSEEHTSEL